MMLMLSFKVDKVFRALLFLFLIIIVSGCSKENEVDSWDYKEGYILYKEDQRILVAPKKINNIKPELFTA